MKRVKGVTPFKILLLFMLLLAVIAGSLMAFPERACASAAGEGSYGVASLSRGGKVSMTLTVDKSTLESYLGDAERFREYAENVIRSVNTSSADTDMVTLESIKDEGETYEVGISTRRVNSNLRGMGDFAWSQLGKFTAEESDSYLRLMLMQNGNLRCLLRKPFGGILGSVEIEAGTNKNQVYIKPVNAITNEELTVEQFSQESAKASKKTYISMFRIPDVKSISGVKVKLPGKVKYVSSECVNVIDEKTVELVPVTLKANLTRYEYRLDENGDLQYDESGVVLMDPVIEKDADIACIFGYVAYELSPNAALISCLSVLGAGLIALAVAAFFKGWFHKFFGIERKPKKEKAAGGEAAAAAAAEVGTGAGVAQTVVFASVPEGGGDTVAVPENSEPAEPAEPVNADDAAAREAAEKLRRKNLRLKSPFAKIVKHKLLYLMLLPSLVLIILFSYIPMFGVIIAFKDYNLIEGFAGSEWVGLKYFKYIFEGTDPAIFLVFRNTIYISLIRVATNFPAILIFALMINEIKSDRLKGLTRTISYLPSFISWIAVGGMMVALFSVDEGMLNAMLTRLLGRTVQINWYAENKYWWMILALSSMWKSLGWGTIIYMSALGCINSELYDACRIDGGGRFRMILSVTLPGIMNVIMLQLIMDAANLVRDNYEQILAMTQGSTALNESTYVVGAMTYSSIMGGSGYSQATAFSLIQGAIGLILVLLTNKIAKKTDNEGVL